MTADKNDSRLILANDPDGDRLAVAEKLPRYIFSCFISQFLLFSFSQASLIFD